MNRERNYRKNPHTARFLQTFHSGIGFNGRNYREELDVEDRAALNFVAGGDGRERPGQTSVAEARMTETQEIFIKGWRILTGEGLVTEKQAKWIVSIAETKANVTDAMVRSLADRLAQGFARRAASEFITRYKDWPNKELSAAGMEAVAPGFTGTGAEFTAAQLKAGHDVPGVEDYTSKASDVEAGRYAIVVDGVTKFYRVTKGKGRWAGRTFVEAQASDELYSVRNKAARDAILAEIAVNPMEAMVRYGHELGVCGRCGRTLTDEASRAAGIGPICASK